MSTVAIELNDSGLLAASDSGLRYPPSPGYALLDGKQLVVGQEAQTRARRKPRWVDNRYWDRLDSDSMPKPFPHSLSRADVAHAHLNQLWDLIIRDLGKGIQPSVLLAIPGSFSARQLGLILGVARASEIPVHGLVDAAVAASSTQPTGTRVLHLEAQLHRMVWTEIAHDEELVRRRVEVLETGGLVAIWDAWAKRVAQLLIHQTRFDPFHHGNAEQTLYDRLPKWLGELATAGNVVATLESDGKERAIELTTADTSAMSGVLVESVVELARVLLGSGEVATMVVSARAATIPGLVARLARVSTTPVIELESLAAVLGALENEQRIASPGGGDLPFVIRLPGERQAPPPIGSQAPQVVEGEPEAVAGPPTHILFEGTAHPITQEPLWLGSSTSRDERCLNVGGLMPGLSRRHCTVSRSGGVVVVEDHSSYGTYLNGRRLEEKGVARIGDRIRLGSPGVELMLIAVAPADV